MNDYRRWTERRPRVLRDPVRPWFSEVLWLEATFETWTDDAGRLMGRRSPWQVVA